MPIKPRKNPMLSAEITHRLGQMLKKTAKKNDESVSRVVRRWLESGAKKEGVK